MDILTRNMIALSAWSVDTAERIHAAPAVDLDWPDDATLEDRAVASASAARARRARGSPTRPRRG